MTITAEDWVNHSTVDASVGARWPDYQAILVAADHLDVASLVEVADGLFGDAHAFARALDPDTQPDTRITTWHAAYRDFGVKPRVARVSVDALTRRAMSDAGLPRINTLVDLYNAISILCCVPIGGEDLGRYDGPARLIVSTGTEPFATNANGEAVVEHPEPGEPIWIDDTGVTCRRWNWRQTSRTAISFDTTCVGFIIDSLDAPDHNDARRAARLLAEYLPNSCTRVITRP